MNDKIASLTIALENELQERDFYLTHSRRTKNPTGKAMFEYIARDEEEHYNRLKTMHDNLRQSNSWPENLCVRMQDKDIMEVLLNTAHRAASQILADNDDKAALNVAIEFEGKAYDFYISLSKAATTSQERNFFNDLASMEREHLNALKETLLYFEDPAEWFARHEKPLLEG